MSEFTAGNLVSIQHLEQLERFNPTYKGPLNEKWAVFFTPNPDISESPPDDIFAGSNEIPILYFFNAEDHGWGYSIVHEQQVKATFELSYEMEELFLMNMVQERYPDEDPIELLYLGENSDRLREELMEELQQDQEFNQRLSRIFDNCQVEQFRLFDIGDESIAGLTEMMTFSYLEGLESPHDLVDQFKQLLQIDDMSWVRPDRTSDYL
ncbi:hypothetical protein [Paenibacillus sp. OV219]|uniref:hypothetical protein n=1 Tax=Paenibacillus sp. OV219 TaxID=1884377 RepID=UPI0008CE1833|nr:hypothetical protein [Paenibacillus sp. OV219]SEO63347.1 hypothetical protein SAMN05518847_10983 [Paenibacillus sp. OV219]